MGSTAAARLTGAMGSTAAARLTDAMGPSLQMAAWH
jgi:hypothetical protein